MSSWLKSIQVALENVSGWDNVDPDGELCPHEHVVGVADKELRKLYYLALQHKKRSQEAAAAMLLLSGKDREAKQKEAEKYDAQADVLRDIFWVSCRSDFPELWGKDSCALRKGWQVVWTEHEEQASNMLGALIGVGILEAMMRRGSLEQPDEEKRDGLGR